MDISSIVHCFFVSKNQVLYCKTNSFDRFRLFWKSMKHNCFGIHFGPILGTFWHTFSILFRHRFSDAFLDAKNLEKNATWTILVGFWTKSYKPEGIRNVIFCEFFRSPVSASIFESFWVGSGFIFDGFGMIIRLFFRIILDLFFDGFGMISRPFFSYNSGLCNHTLAQFWRATLIQFAIFLNLFSDMCILFT